MSKEQEIFFKLAGYFGQVLTSLAFGATYSDELIREQLTKMNETLTELLGEK